MSALTTPSAAATATPSRSFTSWRLATLDAACSDPAVTDSDFRALFMISQGLNEESGEALIGDDTLSDKLPRTDRFKLNDVRKRLEEAGWIEVIRGHGARGSVYHLLDLKVNAILDHRLIDREKRLEARRVRRVQDRERQRAKRTRGGEITTSREVATSPRPQMQEVVKSPRKREVGRGDIATSHVVDLPPVHTHITHSPSQLPVEVESTRTPAPRHAREPAASSSPIVIAPGPDAVMELGQRLGRGSWMKGFDRLERLGPEAAQWRDRAARVGITQSDLITIEARVS